ncbi:hypothetical protein JXQ70_14010 [bacterium]|nr:hypothetical protein [bacterium]
MKSLKQKAGSAWYIDLAVLPFIRRVELYQSWQPLLVCGTAMSLIAIILVAIFDPDNLVPQWLKISLTLLALLFIIAYFLMIIKLPVTRKHRLAYRELCKRGVFLTDQGLHLNLYNTPEQSMDWTDIDNFHITIMESANNTEFLTFHGLDQDISFPFLHLTRADRIPIPNVVEDEGQLYYCYSAKTRLPLLAENNDLYRDLLHRIGSKLSNKRLERLNFKCPHCEASFVLHIRQWRIRKLDVLFCDRCPRLLTIPQSSQPYRDLFDQFADQGIDPIISITGNQIKLCGQVGVEPQEYTLELIEGPLDKVAFRDKRGPAFQKAVENALKACPCGGHFSYQALPRCPECNQSLPELVTGLGFGRYAVLDEELPAEKMWRDEQPIPDPE